MEVISLSGYTAQDKLQIAQKLDELGFEYVEGGYPLSNEKDTRFFQRVREMNLQHAQVCAFGMTRRRGMKAADDPLVETFIGIVRGRTLVRK